MTINEWTELNWTEISNRVKSNLMLRPTTSRPVRLGIKHSSGAYYKIFITVRQLRVCWCGELSLTRGRVYRLQLLLVLASAVILRFEPFVTGDHILLSQIWDFPFRRLLRLAGSRWRYSTPPPHVSPFYTRGEPNRNHPFEQFVHYCVPTGYHGYVF
jgi:hypothetical protein